MERFAKVGESQITTAIMKDFAEKFLDNVKTDCVIVGAGPSGLVAARELAQKGFKVLLIEANNYLGGGFWIGGYLMNGITVRAPANKVLDEIGVPYKKMEEGLYLASGPHACSKLIAATMDAGAKVINMTKFDDVVLREGNRVAGVVVNWTPVSALPRQITCVDPIAIETKLVIDATGHDACVANSLAKRDLLKIKGFGAMWVEQSEDMLVEKTGEVHPGLMLSGMAVATVFGLPRMGPTFGGMLLSGKKVAREAEKLLSKETVDMESLGSEIKERMMA
ncbi:MAG: sulfide-dependent adenosine diphosphate thiazole synthase [Omnitrophica bacterium]|nr:sulfide-dependent adenosine diphosphate thiazole synthase [Candidatus Omnitrophota bacterium]